jgi:hypothetical protein
MFSSTTDLYRWNRFLLSGTPSIVTASTLAQMFVQRVVQFPGGLASRWVCYGIFSFGPTGNKAYFHSGEVPGF